MQLKKEDFERGKRNFKSSLAINRRDFMKTSVAVPAGLGAAYFGYRELHGSPVRAAIIGTGGEGRDAMISQSPPDYLQYVAFHDIRPSQIGKAWDTLELLYGSEARKSVKFYDDRRRMLADPQIEAVVIATPLWTHAEFAIEALEAGKHVFCEKLMAHNVSDAKKMVRTAQLTNRLLGIGHQRHYSTLYADALETVQSGVLGDIRHIRAFWHRNNTHFDAKLGRVRDSWKPDVPKVDRDAVESGKLDVTKYGYKNLEELVRWRLFDRTGGGLMAELGSHQLDACSIFLNKARPLAVTGFGNKYYYDDERECDDHVYCTFEFPDGVVVTYSSINTNALEGYGEEVMGTRGTLFVLTERDVLLFNERDPLAKKRESMEIKETVSGAKAGDSTMYSAASLGLPQEAAKSAGGAQVSRGYREELEHFAYCIRNPGHNVRCDGSVALGDAIMALTANIAIRTKQRIEFKESWFDPESPEVPELLQQQPVTV